VCCYVLRSRHATTVLADQFQPFVKCLTYNAKQPVCYWLQVDVESSQVSTRWILFADLALQVTDNQLPKSSLTRSSLSVQLETHAAVEFITNCCRCYRQMSRFFTIFIVYRICTGCSVKVFHQILNICHAKQQSTRKNQQNNTYQ